MSRNLAFGFVKFYVINNSADVFLFISTIIVCNVNKLRIRLTKRAGDDKMRYSIER